MWVKCDEPIGATCFQEEFQVRGNTDSLDYDDYVSYWAMDKYNARGFKYIALYRRVIHVDAASEIVQWYRFETK